MITSLTYTIEFMCMFVGIIQIKAFFFSAAISAIVIINIISSVSQCTPSPGLVLASILISVLYAVLYIIFLLFHFELCTSDIAADVVVKHPCTFFRRTPPYVHIHPGNGTPQYILLFGLYFVFGEARTNK